MFDRLTATLERLLPCPRPQRRVWARLLTNQETVCRIQATDPVVYLRALVTNLSCAGIHFLLSRSLQEHTLLSVELPGAGGQPGHCVLASVVHVASRPASLWSVGCSFAVELSAEELRAFGAEQGCPPAADRRARVRSPCLLKVPYRVAKPPRLVEGVAGAVDLSSLGVGLVVSQRVEVGVVLKLELPAKDSWEHLTMLAGVVRAVGPVDDTWALGCSFVRELTDAEMLAITEVGEATCPVEANPAWTHR